MAVLVSSAAFAVAHGGRDTIDHAVLALDGIDDRAVMLDPDYLEAHYYRGIQQNALGDLDAARASFRRVLELDPHNLRSKQLKDNPPGDRS